MSRWVTEGAAAAFTAATSSARFLLLPLCPRFFSSFLLFMSSFLCSSSAFTPVELSHGCGLNERMQRAAEHAQLHGVLEGEEGQHRMLGDGGGNEQQQESGKGVTRLPPVSCRFLSRHELLVRCGVESRAALRCALLQLLCEGGCVARLLVLAAAEELARDVSDEV